MRGLSFVLGLGMFLLMLLCSIRAEERPAMTANSRQMIVGLARDWEDSSVTLQRWQKRQGFWEKVGKAVPGRLGSAGLAWGRGLHPEQPGRQKQEGDRRAPAGVFALGEVYAYAGQVTVGRGMRVNEVTSRDLWVEDVNSSLYNQHVRLSGRDPETDWEKQQQMRQNDPAHRLKLFIKHNAGSDIVRGAGSSIFFHIWRDQGSKASFGCTVMAEETLRELIAWVDPAMDPLYVLLPQGVYEEKRVAWGLP
ncbi:MAG: L,D-transpeptidase family protein [Blastochloris sp.]|nr:L,D-transpeptidase family protein [Blastochloris sp.]